MKRVYVAGAYSANNVITVLDNMREGMRASVEVMLLGFAPFSPWLDYQFQLMLREGERFTVQDFYDYSIAWLEVSDAMYVHPNSDWMKSGGTQKEIAYANHHLIPIFYNLNELSKWGRREGYLHG